MAKVREDVKLAKSNKAKKDDREVRRISVTKDPYSEVSWGFDDRAPRGQKKYFRFYRKGKEIAHFADIKPGDCFDLLYDKKHDFFEPRKVQLPHRQHELIMWLFDVPSARRCGDIYSFEAARTAAEESTTRQPYRVFDFHTPDYGFAFVQERENSEPKALAAWVNPRQANGHLVEQILADKNLCQFLGYEDSCVKEIVKFRFGLTERDFKAVSF